MHWMVEQLGLDNAFSGISSALTSGTTSGISGCVRKALLLSTTSAPAAAAMGAYWRLTAAAGRQNAMSTTSNVAWAKLPTVYSCPFQVI